MEFIGLQRQVGSAAVYGARWRCHVATFIWPDQQDPSHVSTCVSQLAPRPQCLPSVSQIGPSTWQSIYRSSRQGWVGPWFNEVNVHAKLENIFKTFTHGRDNGIVLLTRLTAWNSIWRHLVNFIHSNIAWKSCSFLAPNFVVAVVIHLRYWLFAW